MPDLTQVPAPAALGFERAQDPRSIVNAMREYQGMLDAIRHGQTNEQPAACPDDP
jgi:hypothetical protein